MQLVMKVARMQDGNKGGRRRKIDSPYMWTGTHAKHFLAVKRRGWDSKLFSDVMNKAKERTEMRAATARVVAEEGSSSSSSSSACCTGAGQC